MSGTPGPCYIEYPSHVLLEELEPEPALPPARYRLFEAGADGDRIAEAAALIKAAKHPILLVGHAVHTTKSGEKLKELALKMNCPVIQTSGGTAYIEGIEDRTFQYVFSDASIDAVRPAADAKNIQIVAAIDRNAGFIMGEAMRLQQVVWNLLSNSVKFTPAGGTVSIDLQESSSHAELQIADTGIGIGAEFLPHVFEWFRQADGSRTRKHGGLGMGLAIVRHLVESHGGVVLANSRGNEQGSTFTVRIPLRTRPNQAAFAQ